ncbi:MAG TPA: twin-arginine translocation signal domain-containing protein [Candidatus Saccharimonadales bacterium]|nr:twin-arginine translocation signal domain-containing protein [Candidatus Saccharimonadales bacterium]
MAVDQSSPEIEEVPVESLDSQVPEPTGITRGAFLRGAAATGLAALGLRRAGSVLPDVERHSDLSEAFQTKWHKIGFEPGNHDYYSDKDPKKNRDILGEVTAGKFDSHTWNPEVAQRLQQYHPRPKVLTIDSAYTGVSYEKSEDGINKSSNEPDRVSMWAWLPENPSQINPDGPLYVVSSEQLVPVNEGHSFFKEGEEEELRAAFNTKIDKDYKQFPTQLDREAQHDITKLLFVAMGLGAAGIAIDELTTTEQKRHEKSGHVSRRKLLGMAGAGAVAVALGAGVSEERKSLLGKAVETPSLRRKEQFLKLADLISPGSSYTTDWLNARNAMYVLKTKDSMDALQESGAITKEDQAAIVAGGGHSRGVNELLGSDEACVEAIQKYTKALFKLVDKYAKKDQSVKVKESIVEILASVNIFDVRDPKPEATIERSLLKAVRFKGGGRSNRVYDALSELVPSLKKSDQEISIIDNVPEGDIPSDEDLIHTAPANPTVSEADLPPEMSGRI